MMENQEFPQNLKTMHNSRIKFNLNKNQLSCFISQRPTLAPQTKKLHSHHNPKPLIQLLKQHANNHHKPYFSADYGFNQFLLFNKPNYQEQINDEGVAHQKNPLDNVEDSTAELIVSQCLRALNQSSQESNSSIKLSRKLDNGRIMIQYPNQGKNIKGKFKSQDYQFVIYPHLTKIDGRTTLMLRNIPNKYTQEMILQQVCLVGLEKKYDFFYLPIDFKNQCNVGYAFINMIDVEYVQKIYEQFHNKKWTRFNSQKICQVCYARLQGTPQLLNHFRYSNSMTKDHKLRPLIYVDMDHAKKNEKQSSSISISI